MARNVICYEDHNAESLIRLIRGRRVILDVDLARLYGLPTFRLNEAMKRNRERFPSDFAFQLEQQEVADLKSQNAISSSRWGGPRKTPWAFTEHGALMAANVLRSKRAVEMSIFVVRAFVHTRHMLGVSPDLVRKLKELDTKLTARLDGHEVMITEILQQIMHLLNPPPEPDPPSKERIGFGASAHSLPPRSNQRWARMR